MTHRSSFSSSAVAVERPCRRTLRLVVWSLFLVLLVSCTSTGDHQPHTNRVSQPATLDAIRDRGVLRVGLTGDFVPFSFRTESTGAYQGIDVALASDLAAVLDVDVTFVQTDWGVLVDDLLADQFDIGMGGITITPARQRMALFSEPTSVGGKVAIGRDENVQRFRTIAGINQLGVRTIVNPGGTNEAFARKHFTIATIVTNEDNVTIFEKLVAGYADVMVTDRIEAVIQAQIHTELEVANPDHPFSTFEFGYLLPRDSAWKTFVDAWLARRKSDGTFQRTFNAELQKAADSMIE